MEGNPIFCIVTYAWKGEHTHIFATYSMDSAQEFCKACIHYLYL